MKGILDTTGTTLTDYEPERRCVTLKQSKFHDFVQILVPWHRALEAAGRQPTFLKSGGSGGAEPPPKPECLHGPWKLNLSFLGGSAPPDPPPI